VNVPAPPPERIAQWEEQALALLSVRTPPDKVVAHLKYVGCPESVAREIIARNRKPAKRQLRRKGAGILLTGIGILACFLVLSLIEAAIGMRLPLPAEIWWLQYLTLGMILYGILQMIFG
jgi:uncharacterized protein YjeT (DUF2065 family)